MNVDLVSALSDVSIQARCPCVGLEVDAPVLVVLAGVLGDP